MKVKLLTNLGSQDYPGCPYMEGETHDVAEQLGRKLIANRHAVAVADESPEPPAPKAEVLTAKTKTPNKDK